MRHPWRRNLEESNMATSLLQWPCRTTWPIWVVRFYLHIIPLINPRLWGPPMSKRSEPKGFVKTKDSSNATMLYTGQLEITLLRRYKKLFCHQLCTNWHDLVIYSPSRCFIIVSGITGQLTKSTSSKMQSIWWGHKTPHNPLLTSLTNLKRGENVQEQEGRLLSMPWCCQRGSPYCHK